MAARAADETRREVRREIARRSLIDFTVQTCPGYLAGWFHRELALRLERFLADVLAQRSPRLMVFAPPRSGKTELVSRRFPAWTLGKHPDLSVIATSYASDLASRNNRDVQRVIDDDTYQEIFPKVKLWGANVRTTARGTYLRNSDIFEIVGHRGVYRSAGVMGGITGMGGNCLPAGTRVETDAGPIAIEELWRYPGAVKVLAYGGGRLAYAKVQAISRREAARLYRVTTAAGRVVEATGDHPFYSDGRWVEAAALAPGDRLMRLVPAGVREASVPNREGGAAGPDRSLLFARVLGGPPRGQEPQTLPGVWRPTGEQAPPPLCVLQASKEEETRALPAPPGDVPDVQRAIHGGPPGPREVRRILLRDLREPGPLATHGGARQPEMEARGDAPASAGALGQGVQGDAPAHPEARRAAMRQVQRTAPIGGPPPRQLAHEQRGLEPRDPLLPLPPALARGEGREAVEDVVALVEEVGGTALVYDLQVEGLHSFFANGLLTHNCLLIDDPIKDALEASSITYRDRLWDWYTSTLYTRRAPGAGILVILTRWHEDDLAGRLLQAAERGDGEPWDVISYPALAEKDEPHRKMGEALHPERYSTKELEITRQAVGSRVWASLYQQRPSVAEGQIFKRENWGRFKWPGDWNMPVEEVVRLLGIRRVVQSIDSAFKTKQEDDYSADITFGEVPDGWLILDVVKRKVEFPELKRLAIDLAAKWNPHALLVEDKASGQSLIQELKRETRLPVVPIKVDSDKVARANAVTPLHEAGRFKLPEGAPWVSDFVDSLAAFPNGVHDDDVDSFTQGANYLARGGGNLGMFEFMRAQVEQAKGLKEAKAAGLPPPGSIVPVLDAPPPGAFPVLLHSEAPSAVAAVAATIIGLGGAGLVRVGETYYANPGAANADFLKFAVQRQGYVRAA